MNYNELASKEAVLETSQKLQSRGIEVISVNTKQEALDKIKELIPSGASVMNGASATLQEIGFIDYLKSNQHPLNNLHAGIVAETDLAKQSELRKQALLSDYYLGSVHALAQTGEILIASNTGSQLPHIAFSSNNIIFVVGTNKITPNFEEAMNRLHKEVIPKEDERMKGVYGVGTTLNKLLVLYGENPMMGRKVKLILVNEVLGF
jgi:L-lactate utilization protein LutB